MELHFLGGAGSVTGSKFLLETGDARVLVDCGLFQGAKELRLRNWETFPVPPESVAAVLLTHAHLDHAGYVPLLVRGGFRGPVLCTRTTHALSKIVLPDSGRLQEEEASHANKKGYSKHAPALPLYTEKDAERSLDRFEDVPYGQPIEVARRVTATFRRAGHILGSATVTVETPEAVVQFSGDLGRAGHPILRAPDDPVRADVVVVESTYGDRDHGDEDAMEVLGRAISKTAARGGVVVIPAFAVDRTEALLSYVRALMDAGTIPRLTIYVDSPMALAALRVYRDAIARRDADVREDVDAAALDVGSVVEARSVEQSKRLNEIREPAIIVSASGMATGGRVLHHLAHRLPDARNTVILPGFQVPGTRGHALAHGAETLKMHGGYVPVRAEVVQLRGVSAHADSDEIVAWLGRVPDAPSAAYVVHGEPAASASMRDAIRERLGWNAVAPKVRERVRIVPAR